MIRSLPGGRPLWEWLAILTLLGALCLATARGQWLWRLDQSLYDISMALWERPADPDIMIVGIDERSLEALGRWPWRRVLLATLVERIAAGRPQVMALDVILSEPDADPAADDLLASRMRAGVPVVVPLLIESGGGQAREVPPVGPVRTAAARLGLIGLELDQDGLARSVYLREGVGLARHPQLAVAILEAARQRSAAAPLHGERDDLAGDRLSRARVRDYWFQVPFVGPPGAYQQVSAVDVLTGAVPASAFAGKKVLVGATAIGLGDAYPTPVSGGTRPMPGVEIHANVLQALQEGRDIRLAGPMRSGWLAVLAVLSLMLLFLRLSPRLALAVTGAAAAMLLFGSALVLRAFEVWWAPSAALLGVLSAYPLWSWRRLEAAQSYLSEEIARLDAEPQFLPGEVESYRSPDGRGAGGDSIARRIAALRGATQRLRNVRRFVGDALDSLPDATLVVDRKGAIMLANPQAQRLLAVAGDALGGRPVADCLSRFSLRGEVTPAALAAALCEGATLAIEAGLMEGRDGESEFLLQTAPCHADSGERVGGILALIDISALKASERKRDEALRFLSHDMRAPQASILTLLDMMAHHPGAMTTDQFSEKVGRYARRTLNLADEFLRLARAERLRAADFEPVEWVALLEEVRDDCFEAARLRSMQLVLDVGVEEAWVRGDAELLRRVLLNLVGNALKYSPEGRVVRVGLVGDSMPGGAPAWAVFVADQGYGIAEENLPRLFERFARFREEGQPDVDGIGLGLVFVKTVVEGHGGQVRVHSRTVPQTPGGTSGTTFTLLFPGQASPE